MFVICFIRQWMKRSKHGLFVFSLKSTLIWKRHCSTGQSYCNMMSKRSMVWFLGSYREYTHLHPFDKPIKSLYFRSWSSLFCSRVFISRSYENRSIITLLSSLSLCLCRLYSHWESINTDTSNNKISVVTKTIFYRHFGTVISRQHV